jgi:RNA polymerase primary sigma factor
MATRTKTATRETSTTDEVNVDPNGVDETSAASTPTTTVKAPAKAKAAAKTPAAKAPARAKRATKAAASDEPEEDAEPEVVVVDVDGDDTVVVVATEETEDDDTKAKPIEELPKGALVLSIVDDDDDVPVYSSAITGATADPVKDYLKQIGKVALLNAAEEVELAMRIEAGLFAEDKLSEMSDVERKTPLGRELQSLCPWRSATPAEECSFST